MGKWGMVRLGDAAEIQGGYAFKSENFSNSGMPVIRIGNLFNDVVNIDKDICYPQEFWNNNEAFRVLKNDILIAMSGATVGKIGLVLIDEPALLNQRVGKISVKNNVAINRFVYHYVKSDLFMNQIRKAAFGCAQPNISGKQISDIEIPLPPLEVQRKIAETLNAASELLAMRKNQLAELDKLIQSVFYDMFGDPVTNEKGWEITPLENILSFIRNGASIKQGDKSGGYPITRIETISDATVDRSRFGYAGIFDIKHYESYILQDDDILMSHINSIKHLGKSALYKRQNNEIIIHGMNLLCLRPKHNHVEGIYLNYYFKTDDFKIKILGITKPAVNQASFTTKALKDLVIPLPPLESQIEFAETVQKIEKQKALVQKAIDETQALFDSLMNEYFE